MSRQVLFGILAGVFLFGALILAESIPPTRRDVEVFVNVYNHPKTGFSCADKQAGQYYADTATKCAVYYVCIPSPTGALSAQSFACPNGTIFSQATRVCRPHEEVYCPLAERYYDNTRGAIDVVEQVDPLPVPPEVPQVPAHPQPRANRGRSVNHSPVRQQLPIHEAPVQPPPIQELPPPPQPQPTQRLRNTSRQVPQSAPLPVPIAPAPVQAPVPSQAVRPSGGRFRSRLSQTQQLSPVIVPTTTTTTTTTTPPPPPPPAPVPAGPAPARNAGQPANFEYDYGDYADDQDNNTPKQAASELSEQIAELAEFLKPEMKFQEISEPLQRRRRDITEAVEQKEREAEEEELVESKKEPKVVMFSCSDKINGLAYADIENDCSGYFMCVSVSKGKMQAIKLDCGPDEKFHQASGICMTKVSNKECLQSEQYFFYDKYHKQSKKHLIASAAKKFAMSL